MYIIIEQYNHMAIMHIPISDTTVSQSSLLYAFAGLLEQVVLLMHVHKS